MQSLHMFLYIHIYIYTQDPLKSNASTFHPLPILMEARPFAAEGGLHFAALTSWLSGFITLDQLTVILFQAAPASRTSLGAVIRIVVEVQRLPRRRGQGEPLAAIWLAWARPR